MIYMNKPIRVNTALNRSDSPFAASLFFWRMRMCEQAFNQGKTTIKS